MIVLHELIQVKHLEECPVHGKHITMSTNGVFHSLPCSLFSLSQREVAETRDLILFIFTFPYMKAQSRNSIDICCMIDRMEDQRDSLLPLTKTCFALHHISR